MRFSVQNIFAKPKTAISSMASSSRSGRTNLSLCPGRLGADAATDLSPGVEILKHSSCRTEGEIRTREKIAKVVLWSLAILALLAPPASAVVWFVGVGSILFGVVVVAITLVFLGMVAVTIRE
jgi:hypothetical protein